MGRPKNQVPTLQHHRASGQGKVRINGKDVYLGRWGSQEAREAYARLIGERQVMGTSHAATVAVAKPAALTVSDICLLWVDNAEQTFRKDGKLTSHVGTFRQPIRVLRELYGETSAALFGPLALEVVRNRFVVLGLSRKVANRYVQHVRQIFRWACSRELIPSTVVSALETLSPLRAGRTAAREVDPVLPVDDSVVDATLPHLTPIVADMVRLQRCSGMRPGEVCSLRPVDIVRDGDVWKYVPADHKMKHKDRQRVVYLGPQAQGILAKYLLRPATEYCFSPLQSVQQGKEAKAARRTSPARQTTKPTKRKPVRKAGEKFTKDSYRRAVTRACERAFKMPKELRKPEKRAEATAWRAEHCWHPNQLRHTFGTQARQVGGLESVQALLGHSELATAQIYAERQTELALRVARQIG